MAIGDVAAAILGAKLPADAEVPILAKRKSVVRKIDEAKEEEQQRVDAAAPSYLRDDYMLGRGNKAKHWDMDVDDDLADVEDEAEGDSERDFGDEDD